MLLAKGASGLTAWYNAISRGKKEILEKMWLWGRELKVTLKGNLLLHKLIVGKLPLSWQQEEVQRDFRESVELG